MSSKYWAKRARKRMDDYHKDSDRVIGKVLESHQAAIDDINTEMGKIFKTYTAVHKMAPEEAQKYLTIEEKKEFIENLKKSVNYVQDDDLRLEMLRQINAPAYRARLTRLQAMKEKLNVECKKLADIQVREIEKGLMNTAKTAYYRTMFDIQQMTGYGFSFAEMPAKQIEEILKNNWSGKHFSKRIWGNTDKLASELEHTLTKSFMSGASVKRMTKEIADKMQVGEFAATRLIRTETTYVANSAELAAYKEAGVEKYQYLATLDLRTSDICREHDGKIYNLDDAVIGENVPPLHAHCRSTTLEVFEDDNLEELERRAKDPVTGENKTVPANMTYKYWYTENVADNPKAKAEEKKLQNKANDKKQFEQYKEVFGKDTPKSFDKFQGIKYNNVNVWSEMQDYYWAISEGNISSFSTYSDYKAVKKELASKLVGITTFDGVEIKSFSKHMIDRILGASNDPKTGLPRSGTTVDGVLDAIMNPIKIADEKPRKLDKVLEISKKYIGKTTTVSVNPETGNLIQSNPTSEKLVKGLMK